MDLGWGGVWGCASPPGGRGCFIADTSACRQNYSSFCFWFSLFYRAPRVWLHPRQEYFRVLALPMASLLETQAVWLALLFCHVGSGPVSLVVLVAQLGHVTFQSHSFFWFFVQLSSVEMYLPSFSLSTSRGVGTSLSCLE